MQVPTSRKKTTEFCSFAAMKDTILSLCPGPWTDYELIDTGGFEKLERFGKFILSRPEPQAIWDKSLPDTDWKKLAHAHFAK